MNMQDETAALKEQMEQALTVLNPRQRAFALTLAEVLKPRQVPH